MAGPTARTGKQDSNASITRSRGRRARARRTWVFGMKMTQRYPRALQTCASPMPVLPAVPSTTVPPGLSLRAAQHWEKGRERQDTGLTGHVSPRRGRHPARRGPSRSLRGSAARSSRGCCSPSLLRPSLGGSARRARRPVSTTWCCHASASAGLTSGVFPTAPTNPSTAREVNARASGFARTRALSAADTDMARAEMAGGRERQTRSAAVGPVRVGIRGGITLHRESGLLKDRRTGRDLASQRRRHPWS